MPAIAPPPVCASCGACASGCAACPVADTFYKARLPGGLRFLYNRSCHPPPGIATGGHVAVTHTSADAVGARGMWYYLSIAGRRCAPARHFENCLACEGSELASVCAAEPERCRARAAAITKGDERKRAVVQCVGPSLK